ncbi:ATPase [Alphaproteobacteria bacterium]|nr:ATPase [Alphaproteobacteria bacterium]
MTQPYIIVLGNEKGGTGKSTLAMHIIVSFLKSGSSVASLDLDARQGTLSRYLANREKTRKDYDLLIPTHVSILASDNPDRKAAEQEDSEHFSDALTQFQDFDYVVIDTPGNNTPLSRVAHACADTLITPLNDSFIDLDLLVRVETGAMDALHPSVYSASVWDYKKEKASRSGLPMDWIVLRNRLSPLYSKNKEEMFRILKSLSKRIGFRLLDGFCERVIFRELFINGTTLLDLLDIETALTLSHVAARKELRDLMAALEIPVQRRALEEKEAKVA